MSWQEKRNADGEGEESRDRSGFVGLMRYSYCYHCPHSSPTHCHPRYPWATAKQLILLTFTLFFPAPGPMEPGRSLCQHPQWPEVDKRRWLVQPMDSPGTEPMRRPSEAFWEPRSCILCSLIQYVLNKKGLVWVEE